MRYELDTLDLCRLCVGTKMGHFQEKRLPFSLFQSSVKVGGLVQIVVRGKIIRGKSSRIFI